MSEVCRDYTDRFHAISGTIENRLQDIQAISHNALEQLNNAIAQLADDQISDQAKEFFGGLQFTSTNEENDWEPYSYEFINPTPLPVFQTTQVPVDVPTEYTPVVVAEDIRKVVDDAMKGNPGKFTAPQPALDHPDKPTTLRLADILPASPPTYTPPIAPGVTLPTFDLTFTPISIPASTIGVAPQFTAAPPTYEAPNYTPDTLVAFTETVPGFEEPSPPTAALPVFSEAPPAMVLPTTPGVLAEFSEAPPVLDSETGRPPMEAPEFSGVLPAYTPPSLPTEALPTLSRLSAPVVELPAVPDEPTDLDVGLPPEGYQVQMPDFIVPDLAAIISYLAEVQSRYPDDSDITTRQAVLIETAEQIPERIDAIALNKVTALNAFINGLGSWASGYKTQLSTFLDAAQDRIGLPMAAEEAMRARAFATEDRLAFQAEQQVQSEWLARGFTLPGGALQAQISEIRQQNRDKKLALQREIYIETAKLKLETLWKAVDVGVNLEFRYHETWLKAQQLAVETALSQLKAFESTLTAAIQIFSAKVEGWRTELSLASELVRVELAKNDYNKGLVDIERARVDASQAEAQAYKARVDAARARVEVYDAKVRAYVGKINGLMQVYEGYKAEVQAYAAGIQGYSARWQAYESEIKGALATQEGFKGEVAVFQAQTQAYQAAWAGFAARLQAEGAKAGIYQSQSQAYAAQSQGNQAAWQGYTAAVQGEIAKQEAFRSQVQAFAGEVQAWAAQWDGYKALISGKSAQYEGYRAKAQAYAAQAQTIATQWQAYDSQVKGALAPLEGYKAQTQAFAAQVQGYTAQWDSYRSQIQGEIAKAEAQRADAATVQAESQAYSARMQAYEAQIRASLAPLEAYKAQTEVAQSQLQASSAEWQGYQQQWQGEISKQESYRALAQAFAARVNVYAGELDAAKTVAQSLATVEQINAASFNARMDAYKTQLQTVLTAIQKEASVFETDARRYLADIEGQKIHADADIQNNRVLLQKYEANLRKAVTEADLNARVFDNQAKNSISAQDAIARVSAQLVAGALSAMNIGASIGFSGQESSSTSCGESYQYSL